MTVTTTRGTPVTFPVACTDTGPAYEQSEVREFRGTAPSHGEVAQELAGEPFTYTPAPGFTGVDAFQVRSFDALGFGSDTGIVTISVRPPARCNGRAATITGTASGETLVGTAGPGVIAGLGGDDVIRGFGGGDVICGGAGRDKVSGGAGDDIANGDAGRDALSGGAGRDRLSGGTGDDRASGGAGNDSAQRRPRRRRAQRRQRPRHLRRRHGPRPRDGLRAADEHPVARSVEGRPRPPARTRPRPWRRLRDVRAASADPCPCGLGRPYGRCCGRLHRGAASAGTAEELMRSRYAAFAACGTRTLPLAHLALHAPADPDGPGRERALDRSGDRGHDGRRDARPDRKPSGRPTSCPRPGRSRRCRTASAASPGRTAAGRTWTRSTAPAPADRCRRERRGRPPQPSRPASAAASPAASRSAM